jgi:hypothetical protein
MANVLDMKHPVKIVDVQEHNFSRGEIVYPVTGSSDLFPLRLVVGGFII